MNKNALEKLLKDLYNQKISPKEVTDKLSTLPYENLNFVKVDHHRSLRNGLAEVIYSQGKTASQLIAIIKSLYDAENNILATRLSTKTYEQIKKKIPQKSNYNKISSNLIFRIVLLCNK